MDPDRIARAAVALNEGTARVEPVGPGTYRVPSFTGDRTYTVDLKRRTCDCPDALYRGTALCKHIAAVALTRGLKA